MRRTPYKIAMMAACCLALQGIAPVASAIGIHPEVIPDRHEPGMYGPAQLTFDYSDKLGMVIDPKYINNIGPFDAFSLELAFGATVFRAAFSWGHVLAIHHFFKISAEYFAQEPDFSFVSGKDSEWIGQKGLGIEYSYRPDQWKGIYDVHLGVLMNSSECETLSPKPVPAGTNIRRIAGARNYGATLGVSITPWAGALAIIDVHHDSVKFNTKNNINRTLVGVGASVLIEQTVSDRFRIVLEGSDRQPYYEYTALFSSLIDTAPGTRMEIFCSYKLTGGPAVPEQKENRYALGIHYSWGGNKYSSRSSFFDPLRPNLTDRLVHYTNKPAVRPPQIFAIEDQLVV